MGLTCQPSAPFQGYTATFRVTKCVDPVVVDLSLISDIDSEESYRRNFTAGEVVHFGGNVYVNVTMSRNETVLDFQVRIKHC